MPITTSLINVEGRKGNDAGGWRAREEDDRNPLPSFARRYACGAPARFAPPGRGDMTLPSAVGLSDAMMSQSRREAATELVRYDATVPDKYRWLVAWGSQPMRGAADSREHHKKHAARQQTIVGGGQVAVSQSHEDTLSGPRSQGGGILTAIPSHRIHSMAEPIYSVEDRAEVEQRPDGQCLRGDGENGAKPRAANWRRLIRYLFKPRRQTLPGEPGDLTKLAGRPAAAPRGGSLKILVLINDGYLGEMGGIIVIEGAVPLPRRCDQQERAALSNATLVEAGGGKLFETASKRSFSPLRSAAEPGGGGGEGTHAEKSPGQGRPKRFLLATPPCLSTHFLTGRVNVSHAYSPKAPVGVGS
ncbi:hypothetical protein L249_8380, partial [Ophiocordyceps polyrhachis-furcata BCC 54312]